jgi:hypothetical protein
MIFEVSKRREGRRPLTAPPLASLPSPNFGAGKRNIAKLEARALTPCFCAGFTDFEDAL